MGVRDIIWRTKNLMSLLSGVELWTPESDLIFQTNFLFLWFQYDYFNPNTNELLTECCIANELQSIGNDKTKPYIHFSEIRTTNWTKTLEKIPFV